MAVADLCGSAYTRRRLLRSGGAALLAAHLPGAAMAPAALRAIDVHHHALPPAYKSAVADWMRRNAAGVAEVMQWTPERLLQ